MARARADLHVHSDSSDGVLSPVQILARATRKGLGAIAITDHDTLAGWKQAQESSCSDRIILLPGVEINTEVAAREVHILGYCFQDVDGLERELERLRQARWKRARKMLALLQELGKEVTWRDLLSVAGQAAPGRLHLARALVKTGQAVSIVQAFEDYLLPGRAAYVPRHRFSPEQAIDRIRRAGGVAVLAHPGMGVDDSVLDALVSQGLQGIEVYHPSHDAGDTVHYLRLAEYYNLVITGGSDYHGVGGHEAAPIGSTTVSMAAVHQLLEMT